MKTLGSSAMARVLVRSQLLHSQGAAAAFYVWFPSLHLEHSKPSVFKRLNVIKLIISTASSGYTSVELTVSLQLCGHGGGGAGAGGSGALTSATWSQCLHGVVAPTVLPVIAFAVSTQTVALEKENGSGELL